jgi:hypothetical protein
VVLGLFVNPDLALELYLPMLVDWLNISISINPETIHLPSSLYISVL